MDISKLGLIEVVICRATIKEPNEDGELEFEGSNVEPELDPVSERTKKVGWHKAPLKMTKRRQNIWQAPPSNFLKTRSLSIQTV